MKNLMRLSLALLFSLSSIAALQAQKTITDGAITYELKMDESNPAAAMLSDASMELVFKGPKIKTTINMGMLMSMNMVMDNKNDVGVMLMSIPMMGKNIGVEVGSEEFKKLRQEQDVNQAKPKVEYFKKTTKKIAGYKCYKAVASLNGTPVTLYLTDKIKPQGQSQIQQQIPGLTGFPLSYEINQMGAKIIFTAKKVDTASPADTHFDMSIPDGFEKMTIDELKEMGMGGTFGM